MKIVGMFMVCNEDFYIEQAIRNVADFCDIIYVDDNESNDNTPQILARLQEEFDHLHVRTITDTKQSNDNLIQYFGTDNWIFAVDGDELYDPEGLQKMKAKLKDGEFDDWWMIYGNCLHVIEFDKKALSAKGYLSPPSKSMTKLYNFSLISDFPIKDERLHGQPVFKDGNHNVDVRKLHLAKQESWNDSFFRCVHMAFVQRTSKPRTQKRLFGLRLNSAQIYTLTKSWRDRGFFHTFPRAIKMLLQLVLGKDERTRFYKQGKVEQLHVEEFFVR